MSITRELLDRLAQYDTPTICNTIELFDVRPYTEGYMHERIKAAFPELAPMVGRAVTASFRAAKRRDGEDVYSVIGNQLEQIASLTVPAVVVFQDRDEPPVGATFGEVMCSLYQACGAAGLVTSGGGRDLQQVRAIGFPVFTGATICSHAYARTIDVGQPVCVGGLDVSAGDLLHGDANGVTSIPLEIAADVADIAAEYVMAERIVLEYAQAPGEKQLGELFERRQAMADEIARLRRRVSVNRARSHVV